MSLWLGDAEWVDFGIRTEMKIDPQCFGYGQNVDIFECRNIEQAS